MQKELLTKWFLIVKKYIFAYLLHALPSGKLFYEEDKACGISRSDISMKSDIGELLSNPELYCCNHFHKYAIQKGRERLLSTESWGK